jgi:hypothetical protein
MEDLSLSSLFTNSFSKSNTKNFTVRYTDKDGLILNGIVTAVNVDHYEVFIKEKGVIINCTKDFKGQLSCTLNTKVNPVWVDGISKEVERAINQSKSTVQPSSLVVASRYDLP